MTEFYIVTLSQFIEEKRGKILSRTVAAETTMKDDSASKDGLAVVREICVKDIEIIIKTMPPHRQRR